MVAQQACQFILYSDDWWVYWVENRQIEHGLTVSVLCLVSEK
jgi:hypothetical protein